jgi:hypothetical protein
MKNGLRSLLVAFAALLVLAFAGPGPAAVKSQLRVAASRPAAFQPQLQVQQSSYKVGAATTTGIVITADPSHDPTAKMTIFSPAGYSNNLGQAAGATIGSAIAYVKAGSLGGAIVGPLTGPVVVGNPADPALQAAALACTGSSTIQHVWVLNTSLQGQSIQIPAFVSVQGPYLVQQICLQSPVDPRNMFQAQLVAANYTLRGVFTNATSQGGYQWAADFTPYIPGTATVNPAATVEWRNYVGLPSSLTIKRAKSKASLVAFKGALAVAGLTPAGVRLNLYSSTKTQPAPNFTLGTVAGLFGNGKAVRTKAVKRDGKYSISRKRPKGKKRTYFQVRFEDYVLNAGGEPCEGPSPSGQAIPCNGTTLAPLTSKQITVAPRRR